MPICLVVKRPVRLLAAALALCAGPLNAHAESQSEWLFFPAVTAVNRSGLPQGDELARNHVDPTLDVLGIGRFGPMPWLAEIYVSEHEQELARLSVGWQLNPGNTLSVGKFHNLQGYWNTQFHHGAYLQTTIDKPGAVDDSAALPLHYVGAQLEGTLSQWGGGLFNYSLGIGKGAVMKDTALESPDIVGPGKLGDLSLGLRLSYVPDETSPSKAGVFLARNDIPVENSAWTSITQNVGGVFANWESDPFRVIAELYVFSHELEGGGATASGSFLYGYVQGEYRIASSSTAVVRLEDSGGTNNDPLLALLPDFVLNKQLIGLRYDVARNQAIKIEGSRVERQDVSYHQVQIQWSAVFP
ncbi:MAG: hypothetical protein M0Z73_00355 [Betaproteobacteria bacterium]|nr:hypothetical protein [Betaproteobacteria bacterium]